MTSGSSPLRLVVDSNVWVDNYLPVRPGWQESRDFLDEACTVGAQLLYPVHVIKDVFYIISMTLKRQEREANDSLSEQAARAVAEAAWGCVENMRENATAVGADESDVWLAFKYRALHSDLEDDLVLAAAERAQADMLVTKDARLIAKATVPAHTPADAAVLLRG